MNDRNKPGESIHHSSFTTHNSLVPRLRFPEFREAGEWVLSNLGKLFENRQEAGFESLPLLSLTDKDGIIPQEESNRKNNASADKSRYLRVVPGDIAYNTMRMWEGRSAYVDREGIISPAYTVCKPKVSVNGLFYSYYFKTNQLIEQFRRYSQGLVKDTLNLKYAAFSQIPALSPKSEEQQKIADCLSSLDALIAAQADKIDALKTHKKGLMQQLFPREGETVPRLRFPEFRDAGEWEILPLGEIVGFMSGGTPSKDRADYWGGDIPWVSAASMHEISIGRSDRNITQSAVDDGARIIPKGTLLILVRGSMLHKRIPIGITACKVAFNQDVKALRMKSDISEEFLLHLLISNEARLLCAVSGTGIGAGKLDTNELEEFLVCVPQMKGEQQRIASCLSSLDALIAAHTEKLDVLKDHKQGLMQQLFPSPEAI